jgi:hypothetical protein
MINKKLFLKPNYNFELKKYWGNSNKNNFKMQIKI